MSIVTLDTRLQIRDTSVVLYEHRGKCNFNFSTSKEKLADNLAGSKAYSGTVTQGTQARIRRAVNLLLQCCDYRMVFNDILKKVISHRLSFLTLTVSNDDVMLTGKEAYSLLLKPFIQWLTKTKGVTTYIWKAELQNRGQIHYHITLPNWINCMEIRAKWNYLQQKANLLDAYFITHGHYNPNSTDIHAVYKVKDIEAYLVKYISKIDAKPANKVDANNPPTENNNVDSSNEVKSIQGKVWDCSTNLKGKKLFTTQATVTHVRVLDKLVLQGKARKIEVDFVQYYKLDCKANVEVLQGHEHIMYWDYIDTVKFNKKLSRKPVESRSNSRNFDSKLLKHGKGKFERSTAVEFDFTAANDFA